MPSKLAEQEAKDYADDRAWWGNHAVRPNNGLRDESFEGVARSCLCDLQTTISKSP